MRVYRKSILEEIVLLSKEYEEYHGKPPTHVDMNWDEFIEMYGELEKQMCLYTIREINHLGYTIYGLKVKIRD